MKPIFVSPNFHKSLGLIAVVGLVAGSISIVAFAWTGRPIPQEISLVTTGCFGALFGLPLVQNRRTQNDGRANRRAK